MGAAEPWRRAARPAGDAPAGRTCRSDIYRMMNCTVCVTGSPVAVNDKV